MRARGRTIEERGKRARREKIKTERRRALGILTLMARARILQIIYARGIYGGGVCNNNWLIFLGAPGKVARVCARSRILIVSLLWRHFVFVLFNNFGKKWSTISALLSRVCDFSYRDRNKKTFLETAFFSYIHSHKKKLPRHYCHHSRGIHISPVEDRKKLDFEYPRRLPRFFCFCVNINPLLLCCAILSKWYIKSLTTPVASADFHKNSEDSRLWKGRICCIYTSKPITRHAYTRSSKSKDARASGRPFICIGDGKNWGRVPVALTISDDDALDSFQ